MNKTTRPFSEEEFEKILFTLKNGYVQKIDGKKFVRRPNQRAAFALWLEGNLGIRISDVCKLRLKDFYKRNEKEWYILIVEKKTGKRREFYCPCYEEILDFCLTNNIKREEKIINCTPRNIQKQLKQVCDYLRIEDYGTHSCRKRFANLIYQNPTTQHDLVLLQSILQHSNINTTRRYVSCSTEQVKSALSGVVCKF
jgi:integrase